LLTLFTTPVIYLAFDRLGQRLARYFPEPDPEDTAKSERPAE